MDNLFVKVFCFPLMKRTIKSNEGANLEIMTLEISLRCLSQTSNPMSEATRRPLYHVYILIGFYGDLFLLFLTNSYDWDNYGILYVRTKNDCNTIIIQPCFYASGNIHYIDNVGISKRNILWVFRRRSAGPSGTTAVEADYRDVVKKVFLHSSMGL
ncbi:hypothetical protein EAE96_007304 [Botrytis aclada]|nr:hypothetical protein EAE96_007304 [Botrytis aclada]